MLKNITIGAALVTLLAGSALAQSYNPSSGSGNLVGPPNKEYSGPIGPGGRADQGKPGPDHEYFGDLGAYAFAPAPHRTQQRRWYRE